MKAIRVHQFGEPEVLQLDTNVPIPKPCSNHVLLRVKAVGINPVETYIRSGTYARKPSLPFIPGGDCAGVVEEVGSEVTGFKKGDRVCVGNAISGTYAEYAVAPVTSVLRLHDNLTFEQGAGIYVPYMTAYRALFIRGSARPGDTILVHGASGGVGVAAVQLARAMNMRVLGTAGSQRGLDVVLKAGAHTAFNHNEEGYMDSIRKQTEGNGGVDVIVENASHVNLGKDLTVLAKGGRVAVVGCRGPVEINPRDTMSREAMIGGVMLFNSSERDLKESGAAILGGMEAGWLSPIVGKEFPLKEAALAHREIVTGSALGKMVLTVPSD